MASADQTYSFETYIERAGREYDVEVFYEIDGAGRAHVTRVAGTDLYLTKYEFADLDDLAQDHANEIIADLECDIAAASESTVPGRLAA